MRKSLQLQSAANLLLHERRMHACNHSSGKPSKRVRWYSIGNVVGSSVVGSLSASFDHNLPAVYKGLPQLLE
jgi:hypothetical protein